MTRGASTNEVYVSTMEEETAIDVVTESIQRNWIDTSAITSADDVNVDLNYAVTGYWAGRPIPQREYEQRIDFGFDM
jgi:hypothetical protein